MEVIGSLSTVLARLWNPYNLAALHRHLGAIGFEASRSEIARSSRRSSGEHNDPLAALCHRSPRPPLVLVSPTEKACPSWACIHQSIRSTRVNNIGSPSRAWIKTSIRADRYCRAG